MVDFAMWSGPLRMVSGPLKAELATDWQLQSSFRESQLCAKTLPEGTTSSADPTCSQEAWFRLKLGSCGFKPSRERHRCALIGALKDAVLRQSRLDRPADSLSQTSQLSIDPKSSKEAFMQAQV
jgi:hypothetical protein